MEERWGAFGRRFGGRLDKQLAIVEKSKSGSPTTKGPSFFLDAHGEGKRLNLETLPGGPEKEGAQGSTHNP